ncbi:amidase [Ottowia sp.]|uniref:amidase n=1 Tax=Ottowia sp. TaxID=1898956 RepID=UPI003A868E15
MRCMTCALHNLTAHQLLAAYADGSLCPVEVTQDVLAHIERWELHLHATWLLRPEAALAQARESETRWRKGQPLGPLDGVPITLKDNIATAGDPLPLGTRAVPLLPSRADAPPAARLREAGAVLVSKTTMPDYGMLSSGLSSFHPLSRNPWDLALTPGGSSAGAGAAAAAGYGPLHLGTDIGGSIRLPAAWCGVVGFKPSLGRVPIDPPYMGRAAGPMTRTVADAALIMQVLAQPDARDSMALPPQVIDWASVWQQEDQHLSRLRGLKIGLLLDAGCGLAVEPAIHAAVAQAAHLFEAHGAVVKPITPWMTPGLLSGLDHFWRMRSLLDLDALPPEQRHAVLPVIRTWAESARGMSGADVFRAYSATHATRVATQQALRGLDYVISPVSPNTPAQAEWPSPTNDPLRGLEHIGFTVPFNMGEQPAISINCAAMPSPATPGAVLPIGLQIAGQRFDDLGVLELARAFEQIRGPQPPWPAPPAQAAENTRAP